MIRFECMHCDKPCKVEEDQIGQRTRCPTCGAEQLVPRPWRPPQRRNPWILPLTAGLIAVGLLGIWATRPPSADHIRQRLATQLRALSGQWKGTTWETCDPAKGDYKLNAFYAAEHGMYTFEVTCLPGTGQIFMRVDPSPQPPRFLAHVAFMHGQLESFEYLGKSDAEREELEDLTQELAEALGRALR